MRYVALELGCSVYAIKLKAVDSGIATTTAGVSVVGLDLLEVLLLLPPRPPRPLRLRPRPRLLLLLTPPLFFR